MKKIIHAVLLVVTVFSVMVFVNGVTRNTQYQNISINLPPEKMKPLPNAEDLYCLALNIYFEARNQKTLDAKASVGFVVINRMHHNQYANTICDVIATTKVIKGKVYCQFSWYCDGNSNIPNQTNVIERKAWSESKEIAFAILTNKIDNPISDAIMYHTTAISPYWAKHYKPVAAIGDHIFYR